MTDQRIQACETILAQVETALNDAGEAIALAAYHGGQPGGGQRAVDNLQKAMTLIGQAWPQVGQVRRALIESRGGTIACESKGPMGATVILTPPEAIEGVVVPAPVTRLHAVPRDASVSVG